METFSVANNNASLAKKIRGVQNALSVFGKQLRNTDVVHTCFNVQQE